MIEVTALVFDVFGTAVDWRTGIAAVASRHGLPGERFADAWRARYAPSMDLVRRGELEWMNLDALHRRSLDELLEEFGAAGLGEPERRELVLGWHRLPAWPDSAQGLERLRSRYLLATLSNGSDRLGAAYRVANATGQYSASGSISGTWMAAIVTYTAGPAPENPPTASLSVSCKERPPKTPTRLSPTLASRFSPDSPPCATLGSTARWLM